MKTTQRGYALVVVLLLAALLVVGLTLEMSDHTNINVMMSNNMVVQQAAAQASLIRGRILQCATDYPAGNNGTGFNITYPAAATAVAVSTLTCPGNSVNLWLQSDGVTMPQAMPGFGAWQYLNNATGINISVTTTSAVGTNALPALATKLGGQASYSGSTLTWKIL